MNAIVGLMGTSLGNLLQLFFGSMQILRTSPPPAGIVQAYAVGTDCLVDTASVARFAGHPSREQIHAYQNVSWIQQFAL